MATPENRSALTSTWINPVPTSDLEGPIEVRQSLRSRELPSQEKGPSRAPPVVTALDRQITAPLEEFAGTRRSPSLLRSRGSRRTGPCCRPIWPAPRDRVPAHGSAPLLLEGVECLSVATEIPVGGAEVVENGALGGRTDHRGRRPVPPGGSGGATRSSPHTTWRGSPDRSRRWPPWPGLRSLSAARAQRSRRASASANSPSSPSR